MNRVLRQEISRRWMTRFTLQISFYTAVIILLFLCGYFVSSNRIWMGTEPFYPLLHMMHYNWLAAICLFLLFGCLLIAFLNFRKIARLMSEVAEAVSDIYRDREAAVQLPRELKEMENQLNQIRIEAEADRQQAHETNQRKDDMLMYMAHDLKTPLTSVIGYLTLLNDEPDIPEATRQRYMGVVLKKAQRLEELINGFFEITRFNFSHMVLEKSYVNMTMMVNQILYEFQPIFDEKRLHFTFEARKDIFVYCDVEKMERVFDNLFKNVANYSYSDTEIRVCLSERIPEGPMQKLVEGQDTVPEKKEDRQSGTRDRRSGTEETQQSGTRDRQTGTGEGRPGDDREKRRSGGMRLVVENHGRTIPREKLEHLFEQFFRLDSSRDSHTGGSGLGLAVVKEIVQFHGGTVTCESENEIIRFIVELP